MQVHGFSDADWAFIISVQSNGREAVLDKTIGNDWDGDYIKIQQDSWDDNNWAVITQVTSGGRVAVLDKTIGNDWDGDIIHIAKRLTHNVMSENLYINGDIVFDVRSGKCDLHWTSVIAEGDMVVKGDDMFRVRVHSARDKYPNLGTKIGNILSLDTPAGGNIKYRECRGLIYTEFGDVRWNYLDGVAVMGANVELDGLIKLEYDPRWIDPYGFALSVSSIVWQEK